jgi:hypothetical protein
VAENEEMLRLRGEMLAAGYGTKSLAEREEVVRRQWRYSTEYEKYADEFVKRKMTDF